MVGITFKKKCRQTIHLESYTSYKEYLETHKLRVPLDSFICYVMQKFCNSTFVEFRFIPIRIPPEDEKASVTIVEGEGETFTFLINEYDIPWTVAMCTYPVLMSEDVIITGLCAVSRQICYFRNSYVLKQEHEDGLLGFRQTCLQAPNEVSIWTKFCEISMIRSAKELLTNKDIDLVPHSLVRYEIHMGQPVRIHNVYKVAQHLRKRSVCDELQAARVALQNYADKQTTVDQQKNFGQAEQKPPNVEQTEQQPANVKQTEQQPAKVEKQANNEQVQNNEEQGDANLKTNIQQKANADQDEPKGVPEINGQKLSTVAEIPKQQSNVEPKTNAEQIVHQLERLQLEANAEPGCSNVELVANAKHQTNAEPSCSNVELEANAKQQTNAEPGCSNVELEANAEQQVVDKQDEKETPEDPSSSKRTPKTRKWKSQKKKDNVIDSSTKMEDLQVNHEFAEGPFLTLADLVLLTPYHVIIHTIGETRFESLLPLSYKWYKNMLSIPRIQDVFMPLFSQFNLQQLPFDKMTMPTAEEVSLYKCDPKRNNPKKRMYTKDEDIQKALREITEGMELPISENEILSIFTWADIPEHANPYAGYLPTTRVQRKSQQLQNVASAVIDMATEGDVIVDFCCGTGHLGILLAYLMPRCTIILLETKEHSLGTAKERVKKMMLQNVCYYQCNLDFFIGEFDIGIGLHACGGATDLILEKCLKQNAKFVLVPCCYGAIHGTSRMEYPRSKKFASVPFDSYLCIAHAADQTHMEHPLAVRGARCMAIIDSDRARLAEEHEYKVKLMRLKPVTCTPKNNLLVGISTEK